MELSKSGAKEALNKRKSTFSTITSAVGGISKQKGERKKLQFGIIDVPLDEDDADDEDDEDEDPERFWKVASYDSATDKLTIINEICIRPKKKKTSVAHSLSNIDEHESRPGSA